ncbi:hypothetical protein [Mucilaginibacter flavus]|uniref:hypothetical protein n=1 Tax=Mucilaginibacter flavus TaxID=931504 RepID=UPI0025B5EE67|nr:hypothetical protein [Mucilaginibacter flavus]MDN3582088.1 hypothetical protein [Mucilaginibacter flavus]
MQNLVDKDFIVNVGPQGTFRPSGNYQTIPEDIDQMFERFERENIRKIALYFHGGLVNETSGLASARNISVPILSADCQPVCFVWETGLFETIGTNLSKISETKLFHKLLKLLLRKVTEKLGFDTVLGRGAAGPGLTDGEIESELAKPVPFAEYNQIGDHPGARTAVNIEYLAQVYDLENQLNEELASELIKDPELELLAETSGLSVSNNDSAQSRGILTSYNLLSHIVKIAYRIITRFINKRDHNLYPTVMEEILRELYISELGAWVWKMMKDKANDMWSDNTGRQGLDQYAARYFLDKLAAYKEKFQDTEINLIGHSAGSIVICHLLKHTSGLRQAFKYNHIILMAPACRIDLFAAEVLSRSDDFKDIRIFTMSDEYECRDIMLPFIYTHSLLYLISGALEDEGESSDAYILGLERHIRYQLPYNINQLQPCHDYLYLNGLNRVSYSIYNGTTVGLETAAQKHGDFDDDVATLKSITHILAS